MKWTVIRGSLVVACCLSVLGCGGSGAESGGVMPEGQPFLLAEEPSGAVGVVACRVQLADAKQPQDVVLVGRIGGLSQAAWDPQRAVFMVADLDLPVHDAPADGAPKHDADACPFCRDRRDKEMSSTARIQLVDPQGQTPDVDAQRLLGLQEGQIVVVQGQGNVDSLNLLTVQARGVYVRPATALQQAAPATHSAAELTHGSGSAAGPDSTQRGQETESIEDSEDQAN